MSVAECMIVTQCEKMLTSEVISALVNAIDDNVRLFSTEEEKDEFYRVLLSR